MKRVNDENVRGRRHLLLFVNQAISSLTNFAVSFGLARSLSSAEFGRFSLLFAALIGVIGVTRALVGETAMLASATTETDRRSAITSAAGIGVGAAAILSLASTRFSFDPNLAALMVVAFLVIPIQDAQRYLFIGAGRVGRAIASDAIWCVPSLGGLLVFDGNPRAILTTWLCGASIAVLYGTLYARPSRRLGDARAWLVANRRRSTPLLGEFAALSLAQHGVLFIVAGFAGASAAGGFRGVQLLFTPVQILTSAFASLFLADVRRAMIDDARAGTSLVRRLALSLGLIAVALTVVWSVLPDGVGETFLGDTWARSSEVILPYGVMITINAVATGFILALRSQDRLGVVFRARSIIAIASLLAAGSGAWQAGLAGAVYGLLTVNALGGLAWWHLQRRASE
jgi:O-antigen/teichoic acid export membrane protein